MARHLASALLLLGLLASLASAELITLTVSGGSARGGGGGANGGSVRVGDMKLQVDTASTIQDLKALIQQQSGIAANSQLLMMDGKRLRNTRKISDYQMQNGSTVVLVQRQPGMLQPFNRRALQ